MSSIKICSPDIFQLLNRSSVFSCSNNSNDEAMIKNNRRWDVWKSIFNPSLRYLIFPCCCDDIQHWVMMVYDYKTNYINCINTMFSKKEEDFERYVVYLYDFIMCIRSNPPKIHFVKVANQDDVYSCGYRILYFISYFMKTMTSVDAFASLTDDNFRDFAKKFKMN